MGNSPIGSQIPGVPHARRGWRDVVLPKEHGSWSLAFEPLVLGLLVAPSWTGVVFATAVAAAFFARRPLKLYALNSPPGQRPAVRGPLIGCIGMAAVFFSGALVLGGTNWLPWLLPSLAAGAVFLWFDLRNAGREETAEIAGATAFSCLPAAIAVLGGLDATAASALAAVMLSRSVPTVLTVRALLRANKTGERHPAPALIVAAMAVIVVAALTSAGFAPRTALALIALLAVRSGGLLIWPRPAWRARLIGMFESALGVIFVLAIALAWRR